MEYVKFNMFRRHLFQYKEMHIVLSDLMNCVIDESFSFWVTFLKQYESCSWIWFCVFYNWYQSLHLWKIEDDKSGTMSDVKNETEMSGKDSGPTSIRFPMLNSINYTVWSMWMKIALKVNEVWETIDPKCCWSFWWNGYSR